MPDHQSSTDETSRLFGNRNPPPTEWRINLQLLKAFGLAMPLFGLALGPPISSKYVFCDIGEPCVSPQYKEFTKTYIRQLFGFAHTCVWIDNNPGKTPIAVIFIIGLVALMLFTFLDQACLKRDYAAHPCLKNVVAFSRLTWRFRIFCFLLFPMVFVNSPLYDPDPFVDPQDATIKELFADQYWVRFQLHYIPYMLWQLAVALMAIEQAMYHHAMGTFPFIRSKKPIAIYLWVLVILFVYYTLWIVTFLFGFRFPGHTNRDGIEDINANANNRTWGYIVMFGYDILSVLVPLILSVLRAYGVGCPKSEVSVITLSPLKKEEQN